MKQRFAVLLLFLSGTLFTSAQTNDTAAFKKMLREMNARYKAAYPMKSSVQYNYYESASQGPEESISATIVTDGKNQKMVIPGMVENLSTDSFRVFVNHQYQMMSVERVSVPRISEAPFDLDTLVQLLESVTLQTKGQVQIWTMRLDADAGGINKVEIALNTATGMLQHIRMFTPADEEYSGKEFIEIKIISVQKNLASVKAEFDYTTYFQVGANQQVLPKGKLKTYELTTPNLMEP